MSDTEKKLAKLLEQLDSKAHTVAAEKDGSIHVKKWGGVESVVPIKDGHAVDVAALADNELAGFDLDFTISTSDVDRDDDTINQAGWKTGGFEAAGSPVLFAHNRGEFPVAKAVRTFVENAKLRSVARFPSKELHPVGNTAGRLALHGFGMRGASVGFLPQKFSFNEERGPFAIDFEEQELLEWSVLPIPANPNAVAGAKSFGIDLAPVVEWATKWLDGESGGIVVPRHVVEAVLAESKGQPVSLLVSKGADGAFAFEAAPVNADEPTEEAKADESAEATETEPEAKGTEPDLEPTDEPAEAEDKAATEEAAPVCDLCARGFAVVDGCHVVGSVSDAKALACATHEKAAEETATASDSVGVAPEAPAGEASRGLTVADVGRLADAAFRKARAEHTQATTGELAEF